MGKLVLITGGSRSGKSRYATDLAAHIGGDDVTFIATCQPLDDEMVARVTAHQADRPPTWRTVEEPLRIADAVRGCDSEVAVIDCLTLFVTNVLLQHEDDYSAAEAAVVGELAALSEAVSASEATVIVVTNEVGMGLVPEYSLGRAFRDIAGRAGQAMARDADEVFVTVLGIPIKLKPAVGVLGQT